MREKKPEDELRETVRRERKSRQQVRRVLDAIREERRTLRLAVSSIAVIAVVVTAIIVLSYWRSQKQNNRVYAALAKLQTAATNERELIELARKAKAQTDVTGSIDSQRHDAQTTSGGSGGPLFNSAGKVIAINVAILHDFGGSNFVIPVRYAKRLLSQ